MEDNLSGYGIIGSIGNLPRYAKVTVLYNGQDVGMATRLKSLSYTDNSSGTSDEIILTFERRDADWIRNQISIDLGADLEITIWFYNWNKLGEVQKYPCGSFTIDDITFSAVPRQCIVRGVSIPAEESFHEDPISKTWEQITLKQIAQEKCKNMG